jgi:isopentenyl-diphosphate delta-isomerase
VTAAGRTGPPSDPNTDAPSGGAPAGREGDLVELVAQDGTAVGEATVAVAHEAPGLLHRAFSVVLRDPAGRVLLQRRAAVKSRFPLRWANTCCGHPAPGGDLAASAARRLAEELGVTGVELVPVGVHTYAATDPATGRVEREYDHVLVGEVADDLATRPDPAEVAELDWVEPRRLRERLDAEPGRYAPWLAGVFAVAESARGGKR